MVTIKSLTGETDTTTRNICDENHERAVPRSEGGESARDANVAAIGPTGSGPFLDPVFPPREPLRAVSVCRRPNRQDVCPRFVPNIRSCLQPKIIQHVIIPHVTNYPHTLHGIKLSFISHNHPSIRSRSRWIFKGISGVSFFEFGNAGESPTRTLNTLREFFHERFWLRPHPLYGWPRTRISLRFP